MLLSSAIKRPPCAPSITRWSLLKTPIPLWISKNFPLGAPTQTQNTLNQDQIDIKAEHTLKPQVHIFKVIETLCIRYNRNRKKKEKKDNKNN